MGASAAATQIFRAWIFVGALIVLWNNAAADVRIAGVDRAVGAVDTRDGRADA